MKLKGFLTNASNTNKLWKVEVYFCLIEKSQYKRLYLIYNQKFLANRITELNSFGTAD